MTAFLTILLVGVLAATAITVWVWRVTYDSERASVYTLLTWVVTAIVLFVVLASYDYVQSIRAFDASTACEAQQGVPRREPFGARIVCTKSIVRQDTVTVRLP